MPKVVSVVSVAPRAAPIAWTEEEDAALVSALICTQGASWTKIADIVHTRSSRSCRDRFHNHLRFLPRWVKRIPKDVLDAKAIRVTAPRPTPWNVSTVSAVVRTEVEPHGFEPAQPEEPVHEVGLFLMDDESDYAFSFDSVVGLGPIPHLSRPIVCDPPSPSTTLAVSAHPARPVLLAEPKVLEPKVAPLTGLTLRTVPKVAIVAPSVRSPIAFHTIGGLLAPPRSFAACNAELKKMPKAPPPALRDMLRQAGATLASARPHPPAVVYNTAMVCAVISAL